MNSSRHDLKNNKQKGLRILSAVLIVVLFVVLPVCSFSVELDYSKPICAFDANNNGDIEPDEYANCTQQWSCPDPRVPCDPVTHTCVVKEDPICPGGTELNVELDVCEADPEVECPQNYSWDRALDLCTASPVCPAGSVFETSRNRCEIAVVNECPPSYSLNANETLCVKNADCSGGGSYVAERDRCEFPFTPQCPEGYSFDETLFQCVMNPVCSNGSAYDTERDRCEISVTNECPTGYDYDQSHNSCVKEPECPQGYFSATHDLCLLNYTPQCADGWEYVAQRERCERSPVCNPYQGESSSYNPAKDRCEHDADESCPSGYTLVENNGTVSCSSDPSCPYGGTFVPVRDRCEMPYTPSCPAGWSYNAGSERCEKAPYCPAPSYYSGSADLCVADAEFNCPSGYSYNPSRGRCERTPDCPAGGSWNAALKKCVASATSYWTCSANGQTYSSYEECTANCESTSTECRYSEGSDAVVCVGRENECYFYWNGNYLGSSGSSITYNGCTYYAGNEEDIECECPEAPETCIYAYSICRTCTTQGTCTEGHSCPAGYTYDGAQCVSSPVCPNGGSYDASTGLCYTSYQTECPAGFSYDPGLEKCVKSPDCGAGALNNQDDVCVMAYTPQCPQYFSYDDQNNVCYSNEISCPPGGWYDSSVHSCVADVSFSCADGWTLDGNICWKDADCGTGSLDETNDVCFTSYTPSCPTGFTYNPALDKCTHDPVCTGGLYSSSLKKCTAAVIKKCPTSFSYDSEHDVCFKEASCPDGSLNALYDLCFANFTPVCPNGYSYDASRKVCYSAPLCQGGVYDPSLKQCRAEVIKECPASFSYDAALDLCYEDAQCPDGTLDPELHLCTSNPEHNCPAGSSYAKERRMCEAPPQCQKGSYNTETNMCELTADCTGNWSCPLGSSPCEIIKMEDTPDAANQFETHEGDKGFYDDDGEVTEEGCNGQVYVFNGYPMECLTAGIQTGFHNCCSGECDGRIDNYIDQETESYGTLISNTMAYKAIKAAIYAYQAYKAYKAAEIEYAKQYLRHSNNAAGLANAESKIEEEMEALQNYAALEKPKKAVQQVLTINGMKNILFAAGKAYLYSMAIDFATDLAFKAFFGGCTAQDNLTVCYKNHGLCHYVGSYCKEEWPLVGCVQRAKVYCCFNSKLARIVHEQGRPQLKQFSKEGWGDPEDSPNCRGFTPQEFQMLDFSRIDLSEWYADLKTKAQSEIQESLQKNVEEFKEKLR